MKKRFSHRDAKGPLKKTRQQLESEEKKAREELHRRTICKHFVGGLDQECSLGINVRALVGGPDLGWGRRKPCAPNSTLCDKDTMVPCEKYEPPTAEEFEAAEKALWEDVGKALSGTSPCCNAPTTESPKSGKSGWTFCTKCGKTVMHFHRR